MDIAANIQHILTASKDLVLHKLGARERLVTLARSLIATLETPSERIFRLAFAEPANFALVRTAVDLQVFETLKNAGSTPVTVSALAKPANADPVFVHRLMRHLAAMDIVHEASANEFTSTGFTNALTEDRFRGGIIYTYDVLGPSLRRLPEYMKDTTYRNPSDPAGGPFQFAHDTKDPFFPWLMGHEKYMTSFNQYMGGYRVGKPTWLDPGLYPIDSTLTLDTQGEAEKGVLIVDVGGGMGQDLQELKTKQPGVRGRMVLQDLPAVIDQIKDLDAGIERTPHDFFTTQPVAGARVYYLHSVLHDWDDGSCIKILQNIKPAMRPGYSKILINDFVIPNKGAVWAATAMDIGMMALGSVKERTEEDWNTLIQKAGLVIKKITPIEAGSESIVELDIAS